MSRIIKPIDTITLTIDNRTQPCKVDMKTSSDMPIPFVINIFSNLISQLSAQMAQAMAAGMPLKAPETIPDAGKGGSNGTQA